MAAAPTANDLTRQQLDELDALLQRMLSLPNASEPAAQAPALRLTTVVEAPAPPPKPFAFEPPPAPPPEPTTPIIERKVVAPSAQIRAMPLPAAPRPAAPAPASEPETPSHAPVSFFLWPLVGLNWLFDAICGLFGPPGWVIRSGLGKNLLGLAGIGLLLWSVAHTGTTQGWFTLPFPVPWPK
jgi:hypothetical protein